MIKRKVLTIALSILTIFSFSQNQDYKKDTLTCPAFDTTKNPTFSQYNTKQLLNKVESKDPIEILSSFYYLIKSDHEFDLAENYLKIIDNEKRIKFKILTNAHKEVGMIIEFSNEEYEMFYKYKPFQVNTFVYLMFKNLKNDLFPNKNLNTKEELRTLDSVILNYSDKNYLIAHAIQDDHISYTEAYRKKLKSIVDDRRSYSMYELSEALSKIAKFKKEEDIEYIISFDKVQDAFIDHTDVVLKAIKEFTHPKFKPYIHNKIKLLFTTSSPRYASDLSKRKESIKTLAQLFRLPQYFDQNFLYKFINEEFVIDDYKHIFLKEFLSQIIYSYTSKDYPLLKELVINQQYGLFKLGMVCKLMQHEDYQKLKSDIYNAIVTDKFDSGKLPIEFFVKLDNPEFEYLHDYLCTTKDSIKNIKLYLNYFDTKQSYSKNELFNPYDPHNFYSWHYDSSLLERLLSKQIYYESLSVAKLYENNVYRKEAINEMYKILDDTSYHPSFNKLYFLSELVVVMRNNGDTSWNYFDAFMQSELVDASYYLNDILPCAKCVYDKDFKYFYYYMNKIENSTEANHIRQYSGIINDYIFCRKWRINQPEIFYKDLYRDYKKLIKKKYKEGVIDKFEYQNIFILNLKNEKENAKSRGAIFKNYE